MGGALDLGVFGAVNTPPSLALIEPCPDCKLGNYAIYYERSGLVCMAHQPDLESARRLARELGFEFVEVAEREAAA